MTTEKQPTVASMQLFVIPPMPFEPYYSSGGITIYNADCRQVLQSVGDVNAVVTDPPYGISLSDNSKGGRYGRSKKAWQLEIVGDHSQDVGLDVLKWAEEKKVCTLVFGSPKKPWPGDWSSYLVWDKGPAVGGGGDVKRCWKQTWELIQVVRNAPLRVSRDSAVLRYWVNPSLSKQHPAAKPVKLMRYLICQLTHLGDVVFDPFMGTGATLVAAKLEGRQAVGIEINEAYCEKAAKRLSQGVLF
jgi:DNA modification methylase